MSCEDQSDAYTLIRICDHSDVTFVGICYYTHTPKFNYPIFQCNKCTKYWRIKDNYGWFTKEQLNVMSWICIAWFP